MANFFEKTVANGVDAKLASNWVTSDIVGYLKSNKLSFSELKLSPENLAEMINMISVSYTHLTLPTIYSV